MAVYVPGRFLVRWLRLDLDVLEHLAASLVGGAGLLTLIYWSLSMLKVGFLLWVYVLVVLGFESFYAYRDYQKQKSFIPDPGVPRPEVFKDHWLLGVLMLGGMLAQSRFAALTGWQGAEGIRLLAWHAHDAPWHIFNLYQLSHAFPPEMPGFSGHLLKNYHMFSDLLWGAVLRLAPLDPWHCYFRVAPLFYSALLTLTTFVAARRWSGKKPVGYLAAAMTVFCSNFGYVMPLLFGADKYFLWESVFWVQPPLTNIFNPGVSSAFAFLMLGVWALTGWMQEKKQWGYLVLLALFWGVLPGFKVYPGVLVVAGLFVSGAVLLVFQRNWKQWIALAALLPLFLFVFLPPNLHAPSLIRFLPGFNLAAMLVAPDRMMLMSSTQLKLLFAQRPGLVALIMAGLALVFLIGNLGVRAVGMVPMLRTVFSPRRADPILVFITVVIGGALAAPILFVQKGVQWNTIQFFYFAVLLSALPAASQFWKWIAALKRDWQLFWVCIFFGLGIPGSIQAWWVIDFHYQSSAAVCEGAAWLRTNTDPAETILRPLPDALMTEEGYAYWLRSQERGKMTSLGQWQTEAASLAAEDPEPDKSPAIVNVPETVMSHTTGNSMVAASLPAARGTTLVGKENSAHRMENEGPRDGMEAWERTDVAAIAGLALRNTYLEDTVSSQIMGFPVAKRVAAVRDFYAVKDVVEAREFLEKENITYVILYSDRVLPFKPEGVPLKKVFENSAMVIYKHVYQEGW